MDFKSLSAIKFINNTVVIGHIFITSDYVLVYPMCILVYFYFKKFKKWLISTYNNIILQYNKLMKLIKFDV